MASAAGVGHGAGAVKVLVSGATGAIGRHVVAQLLEQPDIEIVGTVGRRALALPAVYGLKQADLEASGRLVQHVLQDFDKDVFQESTTSEIFSGYTHTVCALGTTRKDAGSADAFRRIDHDYALALGKAARDAGVTHTLLVSSQGASAGSWLLYPKTKGQVEEGYKALAFPTLSIYRPGLLDRKEDSRFVEKLAKWIVPSIPVETVARGIVMDVLATAATAPPDNGDIAKLVMGAGGDNAEGPVSRVFSNGEIRKLAAGVPARRGEDPPSPGAAGSGGGGGGDRAASDRP